jgi:3-hydroxyisobutyrate dehydrogenase-like beta-hydroxyacid dehydrogenase
MQRGSPAADRGPIRCVKIGANILAKLGVAGRVEAAAIAHRLGLD